LAADGRHHRKQNLARIRRSGGRPRGESPRAQPVSGTVRARHPYETACTFLVTLCPHGIRRHYPECRPPPRTLSKRVDRRHPALGVNRPPRRVFFLAFPNEAAPRTSTSRLSGRTDCRAAVTWLLLAHLSQVPLRLSLPLVDHGLALIPRLRWRRLRLAPVRQNITVTGNVSTWVPQRADFFGAGPLIRLFCSSARYSFQELQHATTLPRGQWRKSAASCRVPAIKARSPPAPPWRWALLCLPRRRR